MRYDALNWISVNQSLYALIRSCDGIHVPFDPCIVTIYTLRGVVATCGRTASVLDLAPFSYISLQKNPSQR